ncbi:enoyl-CoA hydratase [Bordetella sp. BOR01]|uniref:enoyl-CoA hydratase n=1 Tax=Bordetella sp. BOR01 TaxID=2854779 RepID=UPI001C447E22|nr:enoyl-CoA hydratase [Bordetella sp. BOR01]MBV7485102.1 enoyl-CoA hydratase/isomerase family protein [Bordetella sp. BOR01]
MAIDIPTYPHAAFSLRDDGVGTLEIREAGKLNILSSAVVESLIGMLAHIDRRDDVKVLVLRGAQEKAFVAGSDIKEMAFFDHAAAIAYIDRLRQLCDGVRLLRIPVIARIPGWCLGGGMELALSCDLRIASDQAHMGMPEVKVGVPSIIHAALLPRLIGKARANWMLLTGEVADAKQAESWGLLDRVVPAATLDAEVDRIASMLAGLGQGALAQQKRLLREWEDEPLDVSLQNGVLEFGAAFDTGEPGRYMRAFLDEKARKTGA